MSRRDEPSIAEFIAWVNRLDDPYKVFLWTLINVISLYAMITVGVGIDPDSIKEFFVDTIIKTNGNNTFNFIWSAIVKPILSIGGIIQLIISLYSIWKFGWLGIVVSLTGFIGWVFLIFKTTNNWPQEVFWAGAVLIVISYGFARYSSRLNFDQEGRAIID